MAGTNVIAARQALIAKIRALELTAADGNALQVAFSWPGRDAEREVVHGGKATFDQEPAAFSGGGRAPRNETVTVELYVVVRLPGGTEEDAAVRAAAIGTPIEEAVAADPTLAAAPGLKIARVDGGEVETDSNDDQAVAVLMYEIILRSRLD